jgi:hypothetical protein
MQACKHISATGTIQFPHHAREVIDKPAASGAEINDEVTFINEWNEDGR